MTALKNTAGGAATGAVGGDLSGSLPNPVVARLGGLGRTQVLAQSAVPSSVTGTTALTVLAGILVPAGAVGVNGALRISTLWSLTNNADAKTLSLTLGGVTILTFSVPSNASLNHQFTLINRNAQNSQVAQTTANTTSFGSSGGANQTFSINLANAQTLNLQAQLGTSTDTVTLERYLVEIINP